MLEISVYHLVTIKKSKLEHQSYEWKIEGEGKGEKIKINK
jgi:hypothetical protein